MLYVRDFATQLCTFCFEELIIGTSNILLGQMLPSEADAGVNMSLAWMHQCPSRDTAGRLRSGLRFRTQMLTV